MLPRSNNTLLTDESLSQTHPVESWLQSSTQKVPSTPHSVLNSFARNFLEVPMLGTDIQSSLLGRRTNANQSLRSSLEALDMSLANVDSVGQEAADFVAGIAGQALSLAPLAAEGIGAGIVDVAAPVLKKALPKIIEKEIPKLTFKGLQREAFSQGANRAARYGASFAGFMAPESFEEAYDTETNSFNFGKAAISMSANGAMGAFIPIVPFLGGILKSKLGKGTFEKGIPKLEEAAEKETVEQIKPKVEAAVKAGDMTEEEGIWYVDAAENKDPVKIREDAARILGKQIPVDHQNHNVYLELINQEDTKNIQNAATDQLFNGFTEPEKTAVTDYVFHKGADSVVGNNLLGDGIDGWVGHIDEIFSTKAEKLAIDEEKLLSGVHDNLEFSQARMARVLGKLSHEESHASQLPYTIPDQVAEHLKVQKKIDALRLKQREEGESKQVSRRIEQLEKSQPKLMTPKEELQHLKKKIITDKGLTPFFEAKKDYHRLVELAHYWPQARRLLDKVHLHHAYDGQQVFRNILDNYSKLIKSNVTKFANPEKVSNYLKARLEQTVNKERLNHSEAGSVVQEAGEKEKTPKAAPPKEGEDTQLEAQRQEVEKATSDQSKDIYFQSEKRLKQFKKSAKALSNLINCHLGTTNGQI